MAKFTYLEIIEDKTNEAVRRIDVSDRSERSIDRIEMGMETNLDWDNFTVKRNNSETELPLVN